MYRDCQEFGNEFPIKFFGLKLIRLKIWIENIGAKVNVFNNLFFWNAYGSHLRMVDFKYH